ncbi:MAG: hypothetical protein WCG25_06840 [bacterium]
MAEFVHSGIITDAQSNKSLLGTHKKHHGFIYSKFEYTHSVFKPKENILFKLSVYLMAHIISLKLIFVVTISV